MARSARVEMRKRTTCAFKHHDPQHDKARREKDSAFQWKYQDWEEEFSPSQS
jgi:hypothetical protein